MRAIRNALAGAGLLVAVYGGWLMVHWQSTSQVVQVVAWAVAAVLLHDVVLAPLSLAVGWLTMRGVPRRLAARTAIVLVLVGTTAASGFSVITRSHAGGKNQTLLDRNYPAGLLVAIVVVVACVLGGSYVGDRARRRSSRERSTADGADHGGR